MHLLVQVSAVFGRGEKCVLASPAVVWPKLNAAFPAGPRNRPPILSRHATPDTRSQRPRPYRVTGRVRGSHDGIDVNPTMPGRPCPRLAPPHTNASHVSPGPAYAWTGLPSRPCDALAARPFRSDAVEHFVQQGSPRPRRVGQGADAAWPFRYA